MNTRKRMEDILGGIAPNDEEVWYETTEQLAQPLLACYWSLWECGSGIVAEGPSRMPSHASPKCSHNAACPNACCVNGSSYHGRCTPCR